MMRPVLIVYLAQSLLVYGRAEIGTSDEVKSSDDDVVLMQRHESIPDMSKGKGGLKAEERSAEFAKELFGGSPKKKRDLGGLSSWQKDLGGVIKNGEEKEERSILGAIKTKVAEWERNSAKTFLGGIFGGLIDGINSWLAKVFGTNGSSTAKDATGLPFIIYNGTSKVYLPINTTKGFAFEFLYSMKVSENGLKVNGTHVWVPFYRTENPIQASFVKRDGNHIDYGIANWIWWAEPMSIFGPDTKVGAFEKLISFNRITDDEKPVVREFFDEDASVPGWFMSKIHYLRRAALNLLVLISLGSGQVIKASGMPNPDIIQFAASDDRKPNAAFAESANELRGSLPKTAQPAFSSVTNCYHLNADAWPEGTNFADVLGTWVPLDKKIVSFKGQNWDAPFVAFQGNQGVSVWTYNKGDDRVEAMYGASLVAHLGNAWKASHGDDGIIVGKADGKSWPVSVKAGDTSSDKNMGVALLTKIYNYIPDDPHYLFYSQKYLCPAKLKAEIQADLNKPTGQWQRMFAKAMQIHKRQSSFDLTSIGGALAGAELAMNIFHMTSAVGCAQSGIAPIILDSTAYSVGVATAFIHAITEIPSTRMLAVVSSPGLRQVNSSLI